MSVAFPTFTTEIRFDAGASSTGFELGTALLGYSTLGAAATWTDVSSDVRAININRGKRRIQDEYNSGTANVTLDNTARLYDPNNASGTHYGEIKVGRWIRVKATYDSTDYQLYQGVIREWDFGYNFPNDAIATPRAADFLYDLNNTNVTKTTSAALSGTVVSEILNEANVIPRDIDAGQETFQAVSLSGANALSSIQTAVRSEGAGLAAFYGDETNQMVYEDRWASSTTTRSNTSQATFGTSSLPCQDIELVYAGAEIKNDVTLTRIGGSAQTKTDSDSIDDYGQRSFAQTGYYNNSDGNVANIAQGYLDIFKDAELRVNSITLSARANDALMVQCLSRKIRDRITVTYDPPPSGTVSAQYFITGITHQVKPQDLQTTFTLESVTGRSPYWVLGTSELGTGTKLAF